MNNTSEVIEPEYIPEGLLLHEHFKIGKYISCPDGEYNKNTVIIGAKGLFIENKEVSSKNISPEEKEKLLKFFAMWLYNIPEEEYDHTMANCEEESIYGLCLEDMLRIIQKEAEYTVKQE